MVPLLILLLKRFHLQKIVAALLCIFCLGTPVQGFEGFAPGHKPVPQHIGIEVQAFPEAEQVKPGGQFLFYVVATLQPGWHIYSLEPLDDPSLPTKITRTAGPFKPSGPWQESVPKIVEDKFLGHMVKVHSGRAEFQRLLTVPPGTPDGVYPLSGTLTFRACDNKVCTMPRQIRFNSDIRVAADDNA